MNAARREITLQRVQRVQRVQLLKYEYANETLNVFKCCLFIRFMWARVEKAAEKWKKPPLFPFVYSFRQQFFNLCVCVCVNVLVTAAVGSCFMTNCRVATSWQRPRRIFKPSWAKFLSVATFQTVGSETDANDTSWPLKPLKPLQINPIDYRFQCDLFHREWNLCHPAFLLSALLLSASVFR